METTGSDGCHGPQAQTGRHGSRPVENELVLNWFSTRTVLVEKPLDLIKWDSQMVSSSDE